MFTVKRFSPDGAVVLDYSSENEKAVKHLYQTAPLVGVKVMQHGGKTLRFREGVNAEKKNVNAQRHFDRWIKSKGENQNGPNA